jgi:hypothetical protein
VNRDRVHPVYLGNCHLTFGPDGQVAASAGLGRLPAGCPYRVGDWVRMHAHPGAHYTMERQGMRGFVLGGMGAHLLYGLTDDGRPWVTSYGGLVRDGEPNDSVVTCTCCPRPDLVRERDRPTDLLGLLAGAA